MITPPPLEQSEAEGERAAKEQAFLKNFTIREELAAASREVVSLKARVEVRFLHQPSERGLIPAGI